MSTIGIKKCFTMLANVGPVCLAKPLLRFQQPFNYFTFTRNLKLNMSCTNKPPAGNRTYCRYRGYPLITQTEESDVDEQVDELGAEQLQLKQVKDFVDLLAFAVYEQFAEKMAKAMKMQTAIQKTQPKNWDERPVNFTVLVPPEDFDGKCRPLNIKALKKGSPTVADSKEEILVVDPRVKNWKPPNNLDIVNSKEFEDMSKLLNVATSEDGRPERELLLCDPLEQKDKSIEVPIFKLQSGVLLQTAIENGWPDQWGRDGFNSLLKMVQRVIHAYMVRSKIKPDYTQWTLVHNTGGETCPDEDNTSFAFSQLEDDYIVTKDDLTVVETLGDRTQLDAKLSAIWAEKRWIDTEGTFRKMTYIPDGKLFILKNYKSAAGLYSSTIGLLIGEVTSIHEPVHKPDLFGGTSQRITTAWNQALIGLKYRNETSALLVSPYLTVFMEIKAKNGYIETHVKYYPVMNPVTLKPDQEVFQDLFTDLVKYLWNTYFCDFKY